MNSSFKKCAGIAVILAVLAFITCSGQAAGTGLTLFVSTAGGDGPDCGVYQTNPCGTIQHTVDKLGSGGGTVVLMSPGTFSTSTGETFPITIAAPVTITGGGRANSTIDASGSGQNVMNVSGGIGIVFTLSGVTIKGGIRGLQLSGGVGMNFLAIQIHDNDFTLNGTGIYGYHTTGPVSLNNFYSNTHYGIYDDHATITISRNNFWNNCVGGIPSYDAAIYLNNSSSPILNNLILWNNGSGIYIDGIYEGSWPSVINNSIWLNYGGSGIAAFNLATANITNNIITLNGYVGIHADILGSWSNTYNDVWLNGTQDYLGTSPGTGSISKDPRFASIFDAHLLCSSPAINAGTSSNAPLVDYDNNPRPVAGIFDMGAYEKQTDLYCPVYLPLLHR